MENPASWSDTTKKIRALISENNGKDNGWIKHVAKLLNVEDSTIMEWCKEHRDEVGRGVVGLSLPAFLENRSKEN